MYSIRAKHSREPELKDLINHVDKETALVSDPMFFKEAVEQFWIQEMSKLIREEGLEAMQSEEESKNKPDKDTKKDKCVCALLVMILMSAVYLWP